MVNDYPSLSALSSQFFPEGNNDTTYKVANSLLRPDIYHFRHTKNQAGIMLLEDGTVEIRAGHELENNNLGAALLLLPDGTIQIIAPGGVSMTGKGLSLPGSLSDTLFTTYGETCVNPIFEQSMVASLINPLAQIVTGIDAAGNPQFSQLSQLFNSISLYSPNG